MVPIDFVPIAPATAAVYRVVEPGRSVFVKILRSPKLWPMLAGLPEHVRDRLLAEFPWRDEADFLLSGFALPPGLRMPEVIRIDDLGDRVALWLEDVACADVRWDLPRFVRAARLLGRWAGRRFGGAPSGALRFLIESRPHSEAFQRLESGELRALAARLPELLDRLDRLPHAGAHGDACPQNLLVPLDDPDSFVVIDVTWQCPHPIGFDLGQLLVGLAHDGTLPVCALPEIREAIIDAYVEGLADEGERVPVNEVAFGCDASLVIRSAFDSGPELARYLTGLVRG
ncbi:phosphotransferase [Lentzea tibetensis]|uniref:Phosphotransferase n=1 Tax=Lentzea tibetensis TaxID=2591470 RepID=A0A563EJP3_9PSEU|nr:phosphotransferase [Lentzea tibetensis]